jgi:hypothetical protein
MPCDEQGVWIGPRGDTSDSAEDTPAVALKRFEDELAEFQRLGEERWAGAGDDEAVVKVRSTQPAPPCCLPCSNISVKLQLTISIYQTIEPRNPNPWLKSQDSQGSETC